jgi:hypothetical protein
LHECGLEDLAPSFVYIYSTASIVGGLRDTVKFEHTPNTKNRILLLFLDRIIDDEFQSSMLLSRNGVKSWEL